MKVVARIQRISITLYMFDFYYSKHNIAPKTCKLLRMEQRECAIDPWVMLAQAVNELQIISCCANDEEKHRKR